MLPGISENRRLLVSRVLLLRPTTTHINNVHYIYYNIIYYIYGRNMLCIHRRLFAPYIVLYTILLYNVLVRPDG